MATQTVTWCSIKCLNCTSALPADVILCVPGAVTLTGSSFINGTLTAYSRSTSCGACYNNYTFEYDDAQLLDPGTPLTSAQISGAFCEDCFTNWVIEAVNLIGWYTDNDGNFIQEIGFTGEIIFDDASALIRTNTVDGLDTKTLSITGAGALGTSRGAYLTLSGNEAAAPGQAVLAAGATSTAKLYLLAGQAPDGAVILGDNAANILWAAYPSNGYFLSGNITALVGVDTDSPTDDGILILSSHDSDDNTRGAYITLSGNQQALTGGINLIGGDDPGSFIQLEAQDNITLVIGSSDITVQNTGTLDFNTVGANIRVNDAANGRIGQATLVAGTILVNNTSVNSGTRIFLSRATLGGTAGHLSYTKVDGVSFTINSSSAADTSVINYVLIDVL